MYRGIEIFGLLVMNCYSAYLYFNLFFFEVQYFRGNVEKKKNFKEYTCKLNLKGL